MPTIKRKDRKPVVRIPPHGVPPFAFGRHPFAPPDEADGVVVASAIGRVRLHRAPDGSLVGIVEPHDD